MRRGVVAVGDLNIDILLYLPRYPELGGEALTEHLEVHPGGSAANTAVALARLGVPTSFVGRVGKDFWGQYLLEDLRREGVDVSCVQVDEVHGTGTMVIIVVGRERTILGYRGANKYLTWEPHLSEHLQRFEILHLSGYALLEDPQRSTALQLLREARRLGLQTSLDTGYVLSALGLGKVLEYTRNLITWVLTNEGELRRVLGTLEPATVLKLLEEWGAEAMVVKAGPRGAYLYYRDRTTPYHSPAVDVPVVDTTGAGDAFNAGFLYGVLRRLTLEESCDLANAVAAYKVSGRGARYLPRLEGLRSLLRPELWRKLVGQDL